MSELVAFAQNWSILQTRMDQRRDHMKMNFDYFQIQKWMLQTVKVVELWSLNCPKKCIFSKFVLTSAWNLSLLKQFTYMHLKFLITVSQKMICFIGGLSHRSWDISNYRYRKRCRFSRNLTKFFNSKPQYLWNTKS